MGDIIFSLVSDPEMKAELIFVKRLSLLQFFDSQFSQDGGGGLRIAQNRDIVRYIFQYL